MASTSSGSYPNTWDGVLEAAKEAGTRYPELVAAQWALESGWGKSTSAKGNYFGLKGAGTTARTTEYVNGKPVEVTDSFLEFDGLGEAVAYLVSHWYLDWKGYKGVDRASSRNGAAQELQKQGYATNPNYAKRLIELMDQKAPKAAGGKSQSKSQESRPLMEIVAKEDTWLKREMKQASELGEKDKVAVASGRTYGVVTLEEVPGDAHARVELAAGAGSWYAFMPHWEQRHSQGEAIPREVDWGDFGCLINPYLSVGEVLQWDARRKPGPNSGDIRRILATAEQFRLVREAWGSGLGVTSFYRPEPINQQVGGVPRSRHVSGEAMDVYPTAKSLESFYQWIRVRWSGGLGDGRNKGFIHLDTRNGGHFVPGAGVRPYAEWLY